MKKKFFPLLALIFLLALVACGKKNEDTTTESETTESTKGLTEAELNKLDLPQLTTDVSADEDLVEIQTTMGNIKIKLFPKYAPLACENFVTHARDGYYNGTIFHRVIQSFMIQGGDPKGDGSGGESIWQGKDTEKDSGNGFDNEVVPNLYNLRGALSMANAGENTNGSQFFINTNKEDRSSQFAKQWTPEKIIEAYKKGGNPSLDGGYTVFGQVVEGMDIVDKIAAQPVEKSDSGEESKPLDPVKVNNVVVLQEHK